MLVLAGARRSVHQEEQLARNSHSHSASKRSREADRAKQKQDKQERLRRNRESGVGGIPIASVDEIQVAAMATPMPDLESAEAAPEPRSSSVGGPPCRLFVGSLSRETTSQDLRVLFGELGPVIDAAVLNDRATGESRGFGFVTMDRRSATKAVKALDGHELHGRSIRVNVATERSR